MNHFKSINCRIAAILIIAILMAFISVKTYADRPNCTVTLDDGIYKCYGESSECEINEYISCKGTSLVVFHPDTPE